MSKGTSYRVAVGGQEFSLVHMPWMKYHAWSVVGRCGRCGRRFSVFCRSANVATGRAQQIAAGAEPCGPCAQRKGH